MTPADARPPDALTTLRTVLASAASLAHDLVNDPLLPRFLDVFARMPEEDRETIVNVLEREVDLCNLGKEGPSPLSGLNVAKPNPNARLYLRVSENEPAPYVAPEEIVQAVIRASRVIHRGIERGADVRGVWESAVAEGFRRLGPAERETLRWFHRTLLALLDDVDREPPT